MTPQQLLAVALRLLAVWLSFYVLGDLYVLISSLEKNYSSSALIIGGVFTVSTAILPICLWYFHGRIARKLLDGVSTSAVTPVSASTADTWLAIGCAIIGVWMLASSLPTLVSEIVPIWIDADTANSGMKQVLVQTRGPYYIVRIGLGIWLILGARGVRRIFWWAQNAGIQPKDDHPHTSGR